MEWQVELKIKKLVGVYMNEGLCLSAINLPLLFAQVNGAVCNILRVF